MINRRRAERRSFVEDVYAYVEGSRLDTLTANISTGGAFCRTTADIPVGASVAIVIKKQAEVKEAIFLAGRVTRRQAEPIPGIGVRWLKATTQTSAAELRWFLAGVLGVPEPHVQLEREPGRWEMLAVYRFPEHAPGADEDADVPGPEPPPDTSEPVAPPERAFPLNLASASYPRQPDPGSLTVRITRNSLRAPASIKADLTLAGKTLPARIKYVSTSGLFVETDRTADMGAPAVVSFRIPVDDGYVPVQCHSRVLACEDSVAEGKGLDLEVTRLDEGAHPGVFKKYVRWLHFQVLASEQG